MAESIEARLGEVAEGLERTVAAAPFGSVSVAVSCGEDRLLEAAFGTARRAQQVATTTDTAYYLASVSKPIVASCLMSAVQAGLVDLDRPIDDYLDGCRITAHVGDASAVTVRAVASHTAGLPAYDQYWLLDRPERPPDRAASISRRAHVVSSPGERFCYANFGYTLLDQAIQSAYGCDLAEALQKTIFDPLGMHHSSLDVPSHPARQIAERLDRSGSPYPRITNDIRAAGSIHCSAPDLARFGRMHLGQRDGAPLSDATLAEAHRPCISMPAWDRDDGASYGLGWFLDEDRFGTRTLFHDGESLGATSTLLVAPSQSVVVAVVMNMRSVGDLDHVRIAEDLFAAVSPAFGERHVAERASRRRRSSERRSDSLPDGRWRGAIEFAERAVPIGIESRADSVAVRLDAGAWITASNTLVDGPWFEADVEASIDTTECRRFEHRRVHLDLRLRGDEMTGSAAASGSSNYVSTWTHLTRV